MTCYVVRYAINNMWAKHYFPPANPTEIILLTHFTNALFLVITVSVNVCLLRFSPGGVKQLSSFSENNCSETTYFPVVMAAAYVWIHWFQFYSWVCLHSMLLF